MEKLKMMIALMMCLFVGISYGQWTYKTIDNGFDEPFKKAYTVINNGGFLGMETSEELKTTIEYPDSIVEKRDSIAEKIISITNTLSIGSTMWSDAWVKSDIIAYLSPTSFLSKDSDSSKNINSDFVVSIEEIRPWYKIITTSGTYYIGDKDYFNSGFPSKTTIQSMGALWSKSNILLIRELRDLVEELRNTNNYAIEKTKTVKSPLLYLYGTYFCDDVTTIDLTFTVNGESRKYNFKVYKSDDSKCYYFSKSIWDENFINDFKSASRVKLRVNQSHCTTDYYEFSFSGSSNAINFITI
jgi:hypothetical protein